MTRRLTMISVLLASILAACRPEAADEFRNGVPRQDTVTMKVPGRAAGQALTVEEQQQALKGQTADFYSLTRLVTGVVNGGAFFVGVLVREVVRHPPTTLTDTQATWGPWTEPLDPIAWKVTINKVGEHQFQYKFDGKPKNGPDSGFVTILAGAHTAAIDGSGQAIEGFGHGSFTLDWDARATLPLPNPKEVGTANYTYARMGGNETTEINAQFKQVLDDETKQRVDVDYHFAQQPGADGMMDFVHSAPAGKDKPAGKWAVKSRWKNSGAGRSDIKAANADMPAAFNASECWNEGFASTFLQASWAPGFGYGSEATDCAFPAASYSKFAVN